MVRGIIVVLIGGLGGVVVTGEVGECRCGGVDGGFGWG